MTKKIIIFMICICFSNIIFSQNNEKISFYDFKVKTIDGEEISLSKYAGKKIMVVNVASKCGLTPQYEELEKLYKEFESQNFVILAFPANNFMGQEPGSESEIKTFCTSKYNVTFPMMSKISVKGDDIAPLYKWLTTKKQNDFKNSSVKWNFQKYLIDETGKLVKVIPPTQSPYSEEILEWLKK